MKSISRKFNINIPLILSIFVISVVSCGKDSAEKSEQEIVEPVTVDTLDLPEQKEEKKERLLITYHLDSLFDKAEVDSFRTNFNEAEQRIISNLNRVDAYMIGPGDQLLIPDTLTGDFMDYSPFPEKMDILDSIPKAVLISRRVQAFALFEKGEMKHWGPVSSGKQSTPTPNGLFYGNFKAREKISTVNEAWLMPYYFNFMNFEGVGVHQYAMPGYPASHACVRLKREDAIEIYNWAEQWQLSSNGQVVERNGTPFMVFGDYDFSKPVPWFSLAEDPESNFLTPVEMDTLRNYVCRYLENEKKFDEVKPEGQQLTMPPEDGLETLE